MAEVKNAFIKSKMNKDLDARLIPQGEYRDALNVQVNRSEGDDVGAVENVKGNSIVSIEGNLEQYFNITSDVSSIGHLVDESKYIVYLFLTNNTDSSSTGQTFNTQAKNYIVQYNFKSDTAVMLVEGAFLNFSKTNPILGVNILENLLFFTDDRNQPRKINVDLANPSMVSNPTFYTTEDQISVAKYNPYEVIQLWKVSPLTEAEVITKTLTQSSNDSFDIVVDSASGIIINQGVKGTGVKTNTIVKSVDGNTITLSEKQNLTSGASVTFCELESTLYDVVSKYLPPTAFALDNQGVYPGTTIPVDNVIGVIEAGMLVEGVGIPENTVVVSYTAPNVIVNQDVDIANNEQLSFSLPNPYYEEDYSGDANFLEDKFVRFSYRFKFNDNEYSILAPFTQPCFIPKQDGYFIEGDEQQTFRSSVVSFFENKVNKIDLQIPLPFQADQIASKLGVTDLEIIYKESDELALKVLDTIKVNVISAEATQNNYYEYTYLSQKPIKTLPSDEVTRVYDKVPVRAKAQEVSGNRVIYANFQNKHSSVSSIDYQVGAFEKYRTSNRSSTLSVVSQPNSTVKENRNYQIGVVLSDRFGRSSSVILSNSVDDLSNNFAGTDTIFLPYRSPGDESAAGWAGNSLKIKFNQVLGPSSANYNTGWPGLYNGDVSSENYNPLGWYSYKIVVKQVEQEYYNVYLPGIVNGYFGHTQYHGDEINSTAFTTLLSDNINKVPRDLSEVGPEQKQYRSSVRLFGRVENIALSDPTGIISPNAQYFPLIASDSVEAIGPENEIAGGGSVGQHPSIYQNETNPYLARISTQKGIGIEDPDAGNANFPTLAIYETNPVVSSLDIYWETAQTGTISDLNREISQDDGGVASFIDNFNYVHNESFALGTNLTVGNFWPTDELNQPIATSDIDLVSVFDGVGSSNRVTEWSLTRVNAGNPVPGGGTYAYDSYYLSTNDYFYYGSNAAVNESYTFTFLVTTNGNEVEITKTGNLQNTTPSIDQGSSLSRSIDDNNITSIKFPQTVPMHGWYIGVGAGTFFVDDMRTGEQSNYGFPSSPYISGGADIEEFEFEGMTFTAGTSFPISIPITELDDEEGVVEKNRSFTATSQGDRDEINATDGGEFSYELPYKQELLSISEFSYRLEEEDSDGSTTQRTYITSQGYDNLIPMPWANQTTNRIQIQDFTGVNGANVNGPDDQRDLTWDITTQSSGNYFTISNAGSLTVSPNTPVGEYEATIRLRDAAGAQDTCDLSLVVGRVIGGTSVVPIDNKFLVEDTFTDGEGKVYWFTDNTTNLYNDNELFLNYDFDGNLDSWTSDGFGYDSGTGAARVTAGVDDATISQIIVPPKSYVEVKTNSNDNQPESSGTLVYRGIVKIYASNGTSVVAEYRVNNGEDTGYLQNSSSEAVKLEFEFPRISSYNRFLYSFSCKVLNMVPSYYTGGLTLPTTANSETSGSVCSAPNDSKYTFKGEVIQNSSNVGALEKGAFYVYIYSNSQDLNDTINITASVEYRKSTDFGWSPAYDVNGNLARFEGQWDSTGLTNTSNRNSLDEGVSGGNYTDTNLSRVQMKITSGSTLANGGIIKAFNLPGEYRITHGNLTGTAMQYNNCSSTPNTTSNTVVKIGDVDFNNGESYYTYKLSNVGATCASSTSSTYYAKEFIPRYVTKLYADTSLTSPVTLTPGTYKYGRLLQNGGTDIYNPEFSSGYYTGVFNSSGERVGQVDICI